MLFYNFVIRTMHWNTFCIRVMNVFELFNLIKMQQNFRLADSFCCLECKSSSFGTENRFKIVLLSWNPRMMEWFG